MAVSLSALLAVGLLSKSEPVFDVPYVDPFGHPRQRLDVYRAATEGAPVLLIVHGGGWTNGAKERMRPIAQAHARAGVTAVAVGYRLSPEVAHPAHAEDVAAAVAWTLATIEEHGGDPRRVSILGHSAGAHLVALIATDARFLAAHGRKPTDLRWVIPVDTAAFDLTATGPTAGRLIEAAFGRDREALLAASPITHVTPVGRYPSFLVPYVARRVADSAAQSERLVTALREAGAEAVAMPVEGKSHASILRDHTDPRDAVFRDVVERLKTSRSGTAERLGRTTPCGN